MQESIETGLTTVNKSTGELKETESMSMAQHEIQSAIVVAKKFPRNEDEAYSRLTRACQRSSFADGVEYKFPRGGQQVEGKSVKLAREAARCWGNLRYGLEVIGDDDEQRHIRAWAWDLESNTKLSAEDSFKKLVYRKKTGWTTPDERDLRELTNRLGAILIRNCILQILPEDFTDDAVLIARQTIKSKIKSDPDAAKKKIIFAFQQINVTPEMLEKYLGHPIAQCNENELVDLRGVFQSIRDGNSKWQDYVSNQNEGNGSNGNGSGGLGVKASGRISITDLKQSKTENRGHDDTGFDEPGQPVVNFTENKKPVAAEIKKEATVDLDFDF